MSVCGYDIEEDILFRLSLCNLFSSQITDISALQSSDAAFHLCLKVFFF